MTSAKRAAIGTNTTVFKQLQVTDTSKIKKKASKNGRAMLPFYVPVAARTQLKIMAVEMNSTQQDLMIAALNDFFQKHGKPPIA
ncbi:MAG: hypothetical protein H0U72_13930 [Nitrosospira sp.]|nr:hypothetical protein [Nitrosospira sp.]